MNKSRALDILKYHNDWSKFVDLFPTDWFDRQLADSQEDNNFEHFRYASLLYLIDLYLSNKSQVSLDDIISLIKYDEDQIMAVSSIVINFRKFSNSDMLKLNNELDEDIAALYNSYFG